MPQEKRLKGTGKQMYFVEKLSCEVRWVQVAFLLVCE